VRQDQAAGQSILLRLRRRLRGAPAEHFAAFARNAQRRLCLQVEVLLAV
jgi:hypothetical protein